MYIKRLDKKNKKIKNSLKAEPQDFGQHFAAAFGRVHVFRRQKARRARVAKRIPVKAPLVVLP